MALGKAVLAGAVAAFALPLVMRGDAGQLGQWLQRGIVQLALGDVRLAWSWPLFCLVTLFAWGLFAWADR